MLNSGTNQRILKTFHWGRQKNKVLRLVRRYSPRVAQSDAKRQQQFYGLPISQKQKIIAILGPTASGKSNLAVHVAKKFNGEIISADSRQIYKGMDIGTGKVPNEISNSKFLVSKKGQWSKVKSQKSYVYRGIPHHLLDVASPKKTFTVVDYQRLAKKAINDILSRDKLPILCGGTGLYIDAVLYDINFPRAKANKQLRAQLEKKSAEKLFEELKKLDSRRAKAIDRHNKRRLIRALEIVHATFAPIPPAPVLARPVRSNTSNGASTGAGDKSPYEYLKIGIRIPQKKLRQRINTGVKKALLNGIIEETQRLHDKEKLSWNRLEQFGLWYRYVSLFLQHKLPKNCYIPPHPSLGIGKEVMETRNGFSQKDLNALFVCLSHKSWRYAKRQMTWFRRDKKIKWVSHAKTAETAVRCFLKQNIEES